MPQVGHFGPSIFTKRCTQFEVAYKRCPIGFNDIGQISGLHGTRSQGFQIDDLALICAFPDVNSNFDSRIAMIDS